MRRERWFEMNKRKTTHRNQRNEREAKIDAKRGRKEEKNRRIGRKKI